MFYYNKMVNHLTHIKYEFKFNTKGKKKKSYPPYQISVHY